RFTIELEEGVCPNPTLKHSLELTAQDVLTDLQERFGGAPPEVYPIRIRHGDHPHVDVPTDHVFHIQLGHTLDHPDYARFVYELGHELGHVMIGVTPDDGDGVQEIIPTMASLQALDDLHQKWAISPPYPNFQDYHSSFDSYRASEEADRMRSFPQAVQAAVRDRRWYGVSLYLRYHIKEMDADVESAQSRDLQCLAAILLRANGVALSDLLGYEAHLQAFKAGSGSDPTKAPSSARMLHLVGRNLPTDLLVAQLPAAPEAENGFAFQEGGHWIWLGECAHGDSAAVNQAIQALHPPTLEIRTP
ncbi:MAG TPA: hypothetical protein VKU00_17940, partial [Chthonomonadaceae bacterium]|nr:hypothetical protein [Chthonomonadaceae bacterium]